MKLKITHLTNHVKSDIIEMEHSDLMEYLKNMFPSLKRKGFNEVEEMIRYLNKSQFLHIEKLP